MESQALLQRIEQLETRVAQLEKENLDLRRKLQAYENAHTPPSLSRKKQPPRESNGTLGAPKGHPKYERAEPEPSKTIEYREKVCPECKHRLSKPYRIERRLIEEIPKPKPIEVIEHLICHYHCPNCNKEVTARHNLPKGRFGYNLETHVVLMKFADRLPLRKVSETLLRQYGISITDVGILKIINRASGKLAAEYQKQIMLLRASKVVYVDETQIKLSRQIYWLWVFVSKGQIIFVIRKSRSKKVIEEILGRKFVGVIACDGWTAYSQYSNNLQRCWAHMLREAKELLEKYVDFSVFYKNLKAIYTEIKQIRAKSLSLEQRQHMREKLEESMRHMLDAMDSHMHFREFSTKLRNGLSHWFTCITNLLVEPTNNIAERALRELIVQRKIIGCLRAEQGAETMATTHSILATWKQQNQPLFSTLKEYLSC